MRLLSPLVCALLCCQYPLSGEYEDRISFSLPLQEYAIPPTPPSDSEDMVIALKKISLPEFPKSHNPSIIKMDEGFLLTFRYLPDQSRPWISYIGVVLLDDTLNPISKPELLDTRFGEKKSRIPSQAEDARIFSCSGNLYLIYNDNMETLNPTARERRDMYIAKLSYVDGHFTLSSPIKLFHKQKYFTQLWQKNWVPFEWNNTLLLNYSITPHEVLYPDFTDGSCQALYETRGDMTWKWGPLRGGTPATLVDGEYLAFFHSGIQTKSVASNGNKMWHYYMGAYTFSANPPFQITKISPSPIMAQGLYTKSDYEKRIVFPGGYVVVGSTIYVAYGKDDREVWIALIDKGLLKRSLVSVKLSTK